MNPADLNTPIQPNFCPGCGNFGIMAAFKAAAAKEGWDSSNTALTAGIGCHGHILNFTHITGFEGLHGRSVPLATGIKLANKDLNVFAFCGDGDCLGEGGDHYIHVCRRNHDITIILHDNAIYGLTTGQTSPASPHGFVSKSTPDGNLDWPFNPLILAIGAGATFVARGFSNDLQQLTELIIKANNHRGIAIVDILQPCITFNSKAFPLNFYQENTYYLPESYDSTDKEAAFAKAQEWGEKKIGLGVFYEETKQPSYEAQIPQIAEQPLVSSEPEKRDISAEFIKYQ
ncbi:2-oxoacid ferredoxin oxidoreductase [Candidatus Beckwithbacteria bacterium]|nr:2-oxoacid ferredoxin oxidoreductase [Candidatus Beckwithbacteria bacterium]